LKATFRNEARPLRLSPFSLVGNDFEDISLASFSGKREILNIFPSIDNPATRPNWSDGLRAMNVSSSPPHVGQIICPS
jgi:hypothetical protein